MGQFQFPREGATRLRHGLSFVEFVGCLAALGSGLALGSVYLGVDIRTLFVGVMEQAEIVDPGYFSQNSETPAAETTEGDQSQESANATASTSTGSAEGSEYRTGLSEPNSTNEDTTTDTALESVLNDLIAAGTTEQEPEPTEAEVLAATHTYWKGLTKCIHSEVKNRTQLPDSQSNWQLFDYLSHRAEGHEKAVEAIKALETQAVDEQLAHHGDQIKTWHTAGAKLYRGAVGLLTSSPSDQFNGPSAQSWQSSATQHRMEEKLVRDKHLSISNYLNHTYGASGAFHPAY